LSVGLYSYLRLALWMGLDGGWKGVDTDSLLVVIMVGDVGHPTKTDVRAGDGVEVDWADGSATSTGAFYRSRRRL